jgi:hypothetical protein
MNTARRRLTSPRLQALLDEIERVDQDQSLNAEEKKRKRRQLSSLILDMPEVSPVVKEAFRRLEGRTDLSYKVRDRVIEKLEEGLFRYPEAATSPARLAKLMNQAIKWCIADEGRRGKGRNGERLNTHPDNATSLDSPVGSGGEGDETSLHEMTEGPAGVDVSVTVIQQDEVRQVLRQAEADGPKVHRTILLVILGWSYAKIAEVEEVSENAIAKRVEHFRKRANSLGV